MAKKDEVLGPAVVVAVPNSDGSVTLQHGHHVPGEEELGFKEGASWVVSDEAALALAEALPGAVQEARNAAAHDG